MGAGLALAITAGQAGAVERPGAGTTVQPITTGRADHYFQHFIVQIGLERLGYEVAPHLEAQFPAMHLAIGQGDADYTAVHWNPLHEAFYEKAGGDQRLARVGRLIEGAVQGYLVDRKTAEAHGITDLGQFQDPEIAALFDSDGDGKADLLGCNPGWGCEAVIEHHLDAFDLRDRISHNQGQYFALIADGITRFRQGEPILYYTWTPLWVSSVLKPGEDTHWLDVPFSALPGDRSEADADTAQPDGSNTGFQVNTIGILANAAFLDENPAAERLFEVLEIPLEDVNAAILKQHEGETDIEQIRGHAEAWVSEHQQQFDAWVEEAAAAAD
ncbi:MAG: glycine betaine/L-proline ABC transporter substrate-binding protein ProX [Tistlia sp.]